MTCFGGAHHRRLAASVGKIRDCAAVEQQRENIRTAGACRIDERGIAGTVAGVDGDLAFAREDLNDLDAGRLDCFHERRHPENVDGID